MDTAEPMGPISATAEAAAFGRAIESLRRGPDRLVNDPFARLFLSCHRRWLLAAMQVPSLASALLSVHERRLPGVLGNLLCRTRFIDDALVESLVPPPVEQVAEHNVCRERPPWRSADQEATSIGDSRNATEGVPYRQAQRHQPAEPEVAREGGIEQVVIFGAGFDSRAYRIAALRRLPVFEVDRSSVFSIKRPLLESALGIFPSNVSLVDLDLNDLARSWECGTPQRASPTDFWTPGIAQGHLGQHSLNGALAAAGFNARLPTFFIWEGVTQYLTHDAIDAVFSFVASTAVGSRIVFSYIDQAVIEAGETPADAAISGWVARLGEPWISGFSPDQIGGYLAARHLAIGAHAGAADYRRRYLEPAGRVLALYDKERVVVARVIRNKKRRGG